MRRSESLSESVEFTEIVFVPNSIELPPEDIKKVIIKKLDRKYTNAKESKGAVREMVHQEVEMISGFIDDIDEAHYKRKESVIKK